MFKNQSTELEIAASMESSLITNAIEKQSASINKLASAVEHLGAAAEIFDEIGLDKAAEVAVKLLEVIAAKKGKKSKQKSKSKSKSTTQSKKTTKPAKDKELSGLTSEKMVENLKHKGWVFNADDHDHCACFDHMMTDDNNLAYDDLSASDSNYADPFEKDEHEQDLASMMHQIDDEDDYDFEDDGDMFNDRHEPKNKHPFGRW